MSTAGTSPWLLHVTCCLEPASCCSITPETTGVPPVHTTVNSLLSVTTELFTEESIRTMYWPGVRPTGTSTS
eukprot:scaffold80681_cov66-Phaeocystis_antarctica.AAC.2